MKKIVLCIVVGVLTISCVRKSKYEEVEQDLYTCLESGQTILSEYETLQQKYQELYDEYEALRSSVEAVENNNAEIINAAANLMDDYMTLSNQNANLEAELSRYKRIVSRAKVEADKLKGSINRYYKGSYEGKQVIDKNFLELNRRLLGWQ